MSARLSALVRALSVANSYGGAFAAAGLVFLCVFLEFSLVRSLVLRLSAALSGVKIVQNRCTAGKNHCTVGVFNVESFKTVVLSAFSTSNPSKPLYC